ncbi:hypothetical protein GW17_00035607, partial [Ensete ventricosum]
ERERERERERKRGPHFVCLLEKDSAISRAQTLSSSRCFRLDDNFCGGGVFHESVEETHRVCRRRRVAGYGQEAEARARRIRAEKHFGEELKKRGDQRLILFLAPTVHLVVQAMLWFLFFINFNVNFNCDLQVMVMTPQILLDALWKGFLNLDMVHLMVIDECHHAWGNHPYNRLMKLKFRNINIMPYLFIQCDASLDNYNDTDDIIEASKKDLFSYYDKICHCMDELGLVCAIEVY